ncbi:dipeptidase [Mycolicibacter algericus]|uniref:Dipeptidase n=2 Tax=Mycolicibacter algericus TaxID=1288388 RepID=A0A7I9Y6Q7_MYCAL|nr:dipeptidase [Mycolicibacter algericus]
MPRACVFAHGAPREIGILRTLAPGGVAANLDAMSDLVQRVHDILPSVRADLEELVRIESVWADPVRRPEVQRSAQLSADLLSQAGFPDVRIVAEGGAPAVIARYPAPEGAPTVLLYAHHDVQPEGDATQWASPPFEPTERDGRLYGRGSADDKAGIATHLAAFRAHDGRPPVGVTVFIEGEEESGSPSLGALLAAHRDALRADVIVIADSDNWSTEVPALTVSLRGLADCVVEVATLDHGLHSGLWGGVVPDALSVLVRLLASLHDDDGNVAVAGLHEEGRGPSDFPAYPPERVRADTGLLDGVAEIGSGSVPQRLWAKPAITVIGIDTTSIAASSNTLIPRARAKISMRVAPGGDAAKHLDALKSHLEQHVPWGAQLTVTPGDIGQPYAIDATGPVYEAARAAFRQAWGVEPVDMGMGGSIPFIAEFAAAYPQATILVTGVEDPAAQAHSINESLHLGVLERAATAEALLLAKLGTSTG